MLYIKNAPSALVLTRQNLPVLATTDAAQVVKGGYIVCHEVSELKLIMMASGSEVPLAVEVATELNQQGIGVRVVSMPSQELFNLQTEEYKASILPRNDAVRRMAIEMAHPQSWYQYLGLDDIAVGITSFGASGNANDVLEKYGFTKDAIMEKAQTLLNK